MKIKVVPGGSLWILCYLLQMVNSEWSARCQNIIDQKVPDRCIWEGPTGGADDWCPDVANSPDSGRGYVGQRRCCVEGSNTYRMQVYPMSHAPNYYSTNLLHYTDETMIQEGRSFCIVGEHFYQTQLLHWKQFKNWRHIAERLFDIGNHIDPLDSRLMNTFVPFDTDNIFANRNKGFRNVLNTPNLKHDFKQVYCGTIKHPGPGPNGVLMWWHRESGQYPFCGEASEYPDNNWKEDINPNKHIFRPALYEEAMDPRCSNPYKVLATRIDLDGRQMKNHLHIKIYADVVTTPPAGRKCPTGKMKYVMLEVRDQDGFPVGQFTNDIPCDTVVNREPLSCPPSTAPCSPLYGNKKHFMPCMFSHHLASEAPMIFLAGVEGGSGGAGGNASGPGGPGGGGTVPGGPGPPGPPGGPGGQASYFTEVHATWRFAQMSSHLITELHFATLIIEDDRPIRYFTSRLTDWEGVLKCGRVTLRYRTAPEFGQLRETCPGGKPLFGWKSTEFTHGSNENYHCGLAQFCSLNYHANGTNNTDRPYGFSAQYRMIKPKRKSLGGWGYFQDHVYRDSDVNCHKDIPENDPYFEVINNYPNGKQYAALPVKRNVYLNEIYRDVEGGKGELHDYMTPGRDAVAGCPPQAVPPGAPGFVYGCETLGCKSSTDPTNNIKHIKTWAVVAKDHAGRAMELALKDIWNDPAMVQTYYGTDKKVTEYFGSKYIKQSASPPGPIPEQFKEDLKYSVKEMVAQDKTRCPCPFVPTTEEPELQTKAPVEVQARHLHVVNMLIAWIILVPLAFFVSRYYKETFSKVFFLQEFWWYTIHVLALLTALLFMIGSFYSMHLRREGTNYEILWTDATTLHIYFGYTLVGVFVIHLLLGPFRFWDVGLREIQIWLHWGVGWAEYILAAFTIISAAGIPQGLLNCVSFGLYMAFLVFQLIFYSVMENHIRKVDNQLELVPPRQYFPVHSMRIFHKDAPGSYFRIVMLIAYFLISIFFYAAIHILTVRNPQSCFQKQKAAGAFSII